MLLIQCFQSVVSLVENLADLDTEEIAVGPLRDSFVEAINTSVKIASEAGFKEQQIESAKFAYAVMIDEVMLTRSETIESEWKASLLQEKFFGTITGGDRAALGRYAWGGAAYDRLAAADREMVDSALEQAGALSLKHRLIHELSGGEQARLHLARLLASRAPVLFADEPIAALDPRHQLEAMKVLRSQADKGGSVICALHDLNLARRHADRIAVLHQGRLHAFAAPETALTERVLAEVFGVKPARDGGLALL